MNKIKNFLTLLWSELKLKISFVSIVVMLFLILISILPLIITGINVKGEIGPLPEKIKITQSIFYFNMVIFQGITYALFFRIFNVFKDKSNLEINKVTYLNFKKGNILFCKIISDFSLFIFHIAILSLFAYFFITYYVGGFLPCYFIKRMVVFLLCCSSLYLFTSFGMRIIQYNDSWNNKIKFILYLFWIIFTIINYIIITLVMRLLLNMETWIVDNSIWISFIPFFNLSIISEIYFGNIEIWKSIPVILYTISFVVIFWNYETKETKRFLST